MAELNSRIKPKKSSVAGEVPQAADLEVAELAVNTADGKLFVKHTDDTIKEISGSGGGGGGGAVDSVNGQTGAVDLGIQDMDDFELLPAQPQTAGYNWGNYFNSNQLWDYAVNGRYRMKTTVVEDVDWALSLCSFDSSGVDHDSAWATVQVGDQLTLSEEL